MIIKKLERDDIAAVARIEKECFSHPWCEKSLSDSFNNDCSVFYKAVDNDRIAGYIGAEIIADECYILNVAVIPEYQRRGIGRELVKHLLDSDKELKLITLEVRASNSPAIKMYEKLGFEKVGLRRGYYSEPTEDALIMTLNIL